MAKMGTYGIIRFDLNLFPRAVVDLAPLLLTLGVIGILYGAIVACVTRDLKRLVAYSSLGPPRLHRARHLRPHHPGRDRRRAADGEPRAHHRRALHRHRLDLRAAQDVAASTSCGACSAPRPSWPAVFTVAMLATIGLPGLNGFVGEFLVLVGTFLTHRWWAVVATGGVVLAAIYLLWAYQQAFHHEPDEANAEVRDLSWREVAVVAPLIALIVFLGVYPKPVLDRITPVGRRASCSTSRRAPAPTSPPWPHGGPGRAGPRARRPRRRRRRGADR